MSQAIGSASIVFATLAVSVVLMYAVRATGTLRVSREGELEGLDLHEHGMLAYPEYVIHGYDPTPVFSAPTAAPGMAKAPQPSRAHV
jgi:Amt family ammonium transporter